MQAGVTALMQAPFEGGGSASLPPDTVTHDGFKVAKLLHPSPLCPLPCPWFVC